MVQAKLPPGVVNLVFETGPLYGKPLGVHPDVELISFTGSTNITSTHYSIYSSTGLNFEIFMETCDKILLGEQTFIGIGLRKSCDSFFWLCFG